MGILDIKAKIDNIITCDIEMQVVDKKNIEKRILYYWSKMYSKSITSGKDYDSLEKSIAILITDYALEGLEKIQKYITKWNIREEDYQKIILTDVMEIYIIELPKFEKYKEKANKNLNSWVKFIENPEVVDMKENKNISKAKKVLEEISQDEHERYLAELREKYIMDQKATEDAGFDKGLKVGLQQGMQQGIQEGIQQGIQQGMASGIQQGKKEQKLAIAKNMKIQNIDFELISQVTGLSIEEIKNL